MSKSQIEELCGRIRYESERKGHREVDEKDLENKQYKLEAQKRLAHEVKRGRDFN